MSALENERAWQKRVAQELRGEQFCYDDVTITARSVRVRDLKAGSLIVHGTKLFAVVEDARIDGREVWLIGRKGTGPEYFGINDMVTQLTTEITPSWTGAA